MIRVLLGYGVSAALVLTPPLARASATRHVVDAPARVRVDTSALGSGFEAVEKGINENAQGVVEQSSIDPARVEVVLEWLDAGAFSYFIDVSVTPAVEGAEPVVQRTTCRNCVTDEIVAKTLEHLADVIRMAETADAEVQEAVAEAESRPQEETVIEAPSVEVDHAPRPGGIGPLGWTGVGLLVTGTVTAVTGGVFLGLGERQAANFPTKLRDYGPPGIALVVTGGVALVTGAVLLGLGVRRTHKTHASFGFGPRSAGLTLTRRF